MHVVIAGATGEVGKCLLPLLLNDEKVSKVTVLARRSLEIENSKLEVVKVDFDKLSEYYLQAVDAGVCCLGTTMAKAGSKAAFERVDYEYVVRFAKLVKNANAAQFHVVSASGANKTSFFFYNRVKGAMEDEIKKLAFPTTCIYQPALLDSERQEKRNGERFAILIFRVINPILIGPLKHFRSIKTKDVARGIYNRIIESPFGQNIISSEDIYVNSDLK